MTKPYLMSLGIGFPFWGLWGHRYIDVKKKRRGKFRFLGFHVVWASYAKVLSSRDGPEES